MATTKEVKPVMMETTSIKMDVHPLVVLNQVGLALQVARLQDLFVQKSVVIKKTCTNILAMTETVLVEMVAHLALKISDIFVQMETQADQIHALISAEMVTIKVH